jgi:hypothetical protein
MDDRSFAILVALVVLAIMLVAYFIVASPQKWGHLDYWKANFVESPDQIYARSAGGYDRAAELALRRSIDAYPATPGDHHRAATIIHRNIIAQEHRPARGPGGEATEGARALSRLRLEMFGRGRYHHMEALAGLTEAVVAGDEAARAVHRYNLPDGAVESSGAESSDAESIDAESSDAESSDVESSIDMDRLLRRRPAPPPHPGAEFIVAAALEFAVGGLEALVANDQLIAVMIAEFPEFDEFPNDHDAFWVRPDEALLDIVQDRQAVLIRARRAAAAEVSAARGAGVQASAFLDLSARNTSDSQNSHDPAVNATKRAVVARLRSEQGEVGRLPDLGQISAAIRQNAASFTRDPRTEQPRPALAERAVAVVERARAGNWSASADATDEEVLRRVWARADDAKNAANRTSLRQAAFDALVDSWGRGIGGDHIQCVDGRIGRMVGSLAWLDCDEGNWQMLRLEQHKNEIFGKAGQLIQQAAASAAEQADDAKLRAVGESYLATSVAELAKAGPVDAEVEKAWIVETQARIVEMVDEYAAGLDGSGGAVISKHALEGIKKEAAAALGS